MACNYLKYEGNIRTVPRTRPKNQHKGLIRGKLKLGGELMKDIWEKFLGALFIIILSGTVLLFVIEKDIKGPVVLAVGAVFLMALAKLIGYFIGTVKSAINETVDEAKGKRGKRDKKED